MISKEKECLFIILKPTMQSFRVSLLVITLISISSTSSRCLSRRAVDAIRDALGDLTSGIENVELSREPLEHVPSALKSEAITVKKSPTLPSSEKAELYLIKHKALPPRTLFLCPFRTLLRLSAKLCFDYLQDNEGFLILTDAYYFILLVVYGHVI